MQNSLSRFLLLISCVAVGAALPAAGQNWDPFPVLRSGQHAAVQADLDGPAFDNLRNCLSRFDSAAGAGFYAAVVGVTSIDGSASPERSDAVPYVDALFDAWRTTGQINPETDVLMVVGLRNRAVAVRPGNRWADQGFEGVAVRQAIEASSFASYARSGDYGLALCDLALALDRRIASLGTAVPPGPTSGSLRGPIEAEQRQVTRRSSDSGGWAGCGSAALFGLAILGGVLFWRRRGVRRAKTRTVDELARWKEKIEVAAERVLQIETEHPLYFATSAERWTGESEPYDRAAAEAVNRVFLLYSKAFELQDQADALVAEAGAWSPKPYDEAWQLLQASEVRIETGEVEDRRRIYLPLSQEYRGSSATLLEDLGAAYGAAYEALRKVDEVAEKALQLGEEAGQAAADALAASNQRGELGLSVEHLTLALEPVLNRRTEAEQRVATDPVAATRALEEVIAELAVVTERARVGNEAIAAVREPIQALGETIRQEVARLREAGYRLEEPGFQPDLQLDHGAREARRIESLVAAGEEDDAVRAREALELGLAELQQHLEASEAAREGVPTTLEQLRQARDELANRAPDAEATLSRLQAEHAADAFRDEADNLQELQTLLGRLEEWFGHIADDHREQRYLSALADLERAEELLAEGSDLVDAVAVIEKQLAAARDGAKELAYRSTQWVQRLGEVADATVGGIGAELRRSISDLQARATASLEAVEGPRPQWLHLESTLAAVEEELRRTVGLVEEEIAAHEASLRLATDLDGRLKALDHQVRAETRDRSHVGRAVDDAARQLSAWRARLGEAEFSGSELQRQGQELQAAFEQARGAFETEMNLVREAESRLRAAESLLRQVDGRNFGYGVVANCRSGRRSLRAGDEALHQREWDTALTLAREAQDAIEAERRHCRDQAHMLEQEERRRLAARLAAERREAERRASMRQMNARRRAARRTARTVGTAIGAGIGSSRSSFGSRMGRRISAGSSFGGSRSGGSSW
ncbi:MAG: hypothetical protein AAF657_06465 [Acidobacteriota bacterium]